MCGITGILGRHVSIAGSSHFEMLGRMLASIASRGPDSEGVWASREGSVLLGHRRLAIVDLSEAGHQPMLSEGGRYVIVLNGEIYNHLVLRERLDACNGAPVWRGHSDTETLLACIEKWGIDGAVEASIGMYAMAIWDTQLGCLTLVRDRMGEKPLYYGWQGQGEAAVFLFGSELKALKAHAACQRRIDRGAVRLLMRHNCVPAPYSIYEGIRKLEPGCMVTVSPRDMSVREKRYWSIPAVACGGKADRFQGRPVEAVNALEEILKAAVKQQMMADVPLGAFLSGGIDSSTIVSLMQSQVTNPIQTFTIGFADSGYNEAAAAKAIASHLGTSHAEMYVTASEALGVIPHLPRLFCEPFSDSSQIPTAILCRFARRNVTAALSGDGGDELFCGYNRHVFAAVSWPKLRRLPIAVRKCVSRMLFSSSGRAMARLVDVLGPSVSPRRIHVQAIDKVRKLSMALEARSSDELYRGFVSHWGNAEQIVIGAEEPLTVLDRDYPGMEGLDDVERMMVLDTMTFLPDDVLVKVDRSAMGVSLECRCPFLDHRVVEFAWRLPSDLKLREGQAKWALRKVAEKYLPAKLLDRPKQGFSMPIGNWLRGPLRDWAENLLDEKILRQQGYLHVAPIREKWRQHLAGTGNWQYLLWDVLMFQAWLAAEDT